MKKIVITTIIIVIIILIPLISMTLIPVQEKEIMNDVNETSILLSNQSELDFENILKTQNKTLLIDQKSFSGNSKINFVIGLNNNGEKGDFEVKIQEIDSKINSEESTKIFVSEPKLTLEKNEVKIIQIDAKNNQLNEERAEAFKFIILKNDKIVVEEIIFINWVK